MVTSVGANAFARRIRDIGERIEENASDIVRKAALAADQAVVSGTPVDKGTARLNWQVSTGAPITNTLPEPSSKEAGRRQALDQGKTAVEKWKVGDPAIYIANNLPYIKRLNDGYSAQAPEGMVDQARLAAEDVLKRGGLLKGI
jgi:hypothetical protein